MSKRILVVGSLAKGALEHSYISAAKELGYHIESFDPAQEQAVYIKGGILGRKLHAFLPVEQWMRKMNRNLVLRARSYQPDILLLFTNVRVLPGTLACIKTILPSMKLVWIWPDTPLNLEKHNFVNGKLADLTATYSEASVPVFKKLDFSNVHWVPLAADPHMHRVNGFPNDFSTDIGFVGGWRPERERVMAILCDAFPQLNIAIHGPYWHRECKHAGVKQKIKSEGLYEKSLAAFFNSARININIIDDTNYPAANMRFFEVPVAGGLQVSSSCPEQEKIFEHRRDIIYYKDEAKILDEVKWVIAHPEEATAIRVSASKLVLNSQCYKHRLEYILTEVDRITG